MRENVKPRMVRVEASTHCQLRCPSCPTTRGDIDAALGKGFLRLDDFRNLLDSNPHLRSVELSNYGEILLNPQLVAILEHAHERGVAITMTGVNFDRATPEQLEAIVRTQVRRLTVSIDGASQETYVQYRVRGHYDRVLAHVREVARLKQLHRSGFPEMTWQFIAFGHNQHEIPAARALAESLGMRFHVKLSWDDAFSPIVDRGALARELGTNAVTRSEVFEASGEPYLGSICNQLWEEPQVNWNGDMIGCCRNFWGTFGGNAFRDGLQTAVNSEGMRQARAMLTGRAEAVPGVPCTTCDLYLARARTGHWMRSPEALGEKVRHSVRRIQWRLRKLARSLARNR